MADENEKSEMDALKSQYNHLRYEVEGIGRDVSELISDANKIKTDVAEIKKMHKASAKTLKAHFSAGRPKIRVNLKDPNANEEKTKTEALTDLQSYFHGMAEDYRFNETLQASIRAKIASFYLEGINFDNAKYDSVVFDIANIMEGQYGSKESK